ncbi:MAG: Gfo/Idh/MocA family oxidoreductase [Chthoniobacteraceae bacterium]|nr:Gfo/Idh/MocA family oxidoreductase [Chthoniobacteraceae bacterium]
MPENYELTAAPLPRIVAPDLPYRPPRPKFYRPRIGLIGCGGIADYHLQAAKAQEVEVAAFYNPSIEKARNRRDSYFPQGHVCASVEELLMYPGVEVVDIATHADVRGPLIEAALRAGKHVLSQKPFTLDLAEGRRLVLLARDLGLCLAVNQNGRWAPYFSYLLQAASSGLLGEMQTLELTMNWDHTWIQGTAFEQMPHLLLQDFAIHWFDIAATVFADRAVGRICCNTMRLPGETISAPLAASAFVEFEGGLSTLAFNGYSKLGQREQFVAVGSRGTLRGAGPLCGIRSLALFTSQGEAEIGLNGAWFPDGFTGALGELLCAIEEGREPSHSAANNLRSLEIVFAAMRSAAEPCPASPATVR